MVYLPTSALADNWNRSVPIMFQMSRTQVGELQGPCDKSRHGHAEDIRLEISCCLNFPNGHKTEYVHYKSKANFDTIILNFV